MKFIKSLYRENLIGTYYTKKDLEHNEDTFILRCIQNAFSAFFCVFFNIVSIGKMC